MSSKRIASALQTLSAASPEELQPYSNEVLRVLRRLLPVDDLGVAARQPSALPPPDVGTLVQESQAYLSVPQDTPENPSSVQSSPPQDFNRSTALSSIDGSWIGGHDSLSSTRQPPRSNERPLGSQCWPGGSASVDSSVERFLTDQPWVDLSVSTSSSDRPNIDNRISREDTNWIGVSASQPGPHQNQRRAERSLTNLSWVDTSITSDLCQPHNENGWPSFSAETTRCDMNPLPASLAADCPSLLSLDNTCLPSTPVPGLRPAVSESEENQQAPANNRCSGSDKLWEKFQMNKKVIKEYLKHPVPEAVGVPASTYEDIRLLDIECVDGQSNPTFQNVFRKLLAHRSITNQYNDWRGSHSQSRYFSKARFSNNGNFSNPNAIAYALKYGLKLERMEKAKKLPTISILFCVSFWEFKRTTELEAIRFVEKMETSEPEVWSLLKASAGWFEDCQTLYSNTCDAINRERRNGNNRKRQIDLCIERDRKRPSLKELKGSGRSIQHGS